MIFKTSENKTIPTPTEPTDVIKNLMTCPTQSRNTGYVSPNTAIFTLANTLKSSIIYSFHLRRFFTASVFFILRLYSQVLPWCNVAHNSHFALSQRSGAGSLLPPSTKGLHRRIRHEPSSMPTITPWLWIHSKVYCEQVGRYIQVCFDKCF